MENLVKAQEKGWRDKTVLVTGVTGFVGSSLGVRLIKLGAKVIGLVPDQAAESNFNRLKLDQAITVVNGDLEDFHLLKRVIQEYRIQVIYHLGAQALVGIAHQSPLSTFKTNIEGTWNLLEACREKKAIEAVIVASSDKAYGTHRKLPYREDFPLQPEYPYDVSKACADLIARSYYKTYGLPVVVTRFANIYGPGDFNFSRIIPNAMRSVLQGKNPTLRSDGTPERDYLYIGDAIDLYLLLAERIEETKGHVFNAGHNKPVSVLSLVQMILRLAGRTDLKPEMRDKGNPKGEINRQYLDGRKVRRMLGWRPKVTLEDGLRMALEWYRAEHDS